MLTNLDLLNSEGNLNELRSMILPDRLRVYILELGTNLSIPWILLPSWFPPSFKICKLDDCLINAMRALPASTWRLHFSN